MSAVALLPVPATARARSRLELVATAAQARQAGGAFRRWVGRQK
jgi:hypothetical protein